MKESKYRTAADIMTRKPTVVYSSATIREVADWFLENDYSSAPVLGSTGEILGILDEFALIRVKLIQHFHEESKDKVAHHVELLGAPHFVFEDTTVVDVIREMVRAPNHRVLVVNRAEQLQGIISPKDILKIVAGERKKTAGLKEQLEKTRQDLSAIKHELQKMKSRLEIYKDMVMDNPNMIHSVSAEGRILMANKKMHDNLGYKYGELIGKGIEDLYAPAMHPEAFQGLKKIMETGSHQNTFTTMLTKNGEKIRVDVASTAIFDDDKRFIGTISVSRQVDSDILLRALHGALTKDVIDGSRYGLIQDGEDPKVSSEDPTSGGKKSE